MPYDAGDHTKEVYAHFGLAYYLAGGANADSAGDGVVEPQQTSIQVF